MDFQDMETINVSVLLIVAAFLLYAAISDLKNRRIPNHISIGLIVVFLVHSLMMIMAGEISFTDLLFSILPALGVFCIGILVFAVGIMGGGDIKLMTAFALFAGHAYLFSFLIYMMILGGAIAILLLFFRKLGNVSKEKSEQVPYGIAIAGSGLWVLWQHSVQILTN